MVSNYVRLMPASCFPSSGAGDLLGTRPKDQSILRQNYRSFCPPTMPDFQPRHEEQVRLMLQALLVEQVQFNVSHKEMKLLPVYALIVAKNGPKLKTAKSQESASQPEWRKSR